MKGMERKEGKEKIGCKKGMKRKEGKEKIGCKEGTERSRDKKRSKMNIDEEEGCFEVYITVNNSSRENNRNSEK